MEKRGEATLWFLIEVIAAFAVAFLAIEIARELSTGTYFEKLHIARDISMQINTLSSINGDAYLVYDNLAGYSLQITGNKIEVFDQADKIKAAHFFARSKSQNLDIKINSKEENKIFIYKIGDQIKISQILPEIFK